MYAHDNLERPERVGKLDAIQNHIGNFFDLLGSGKPTISDPVSQHASATLCHLGNIACQIGRPIRWDNASQTILDDREAQGLCQRPQRAGYEVKESS
jgi:L-rhamnose isomerase